MIGEPQVGQGRRFRSRLVHRAGKEGRGVRGGVGDVWSTWIFK